MTESTPTQVSPLVHPLAHPLLLLLLLSAPVAANAASYRGGCSFGEGHRSLNQFHLVNVYIGYHYLFWDFFLIYLFVKNKLLNQR